MVPIDLLIGGSPCNDFSIANPLRQGLEGKFLYLRINVTKTDKCKNFVFAISSSAVIEVLLLLCIFSSCTTSFTHLFSVWFHWWLYTAASRETRTEVVY